VSNRAGTGALGDVCRGLAARKFGFDLMTDGEAQAFSARSFSLTMA
jgi:hypothetical protein